MKDIKIALKAIAHHDENKKIMYRHAARKVWRTYLLLPLAAGIGAYGFFSALCSMFVPIVKLYAQTSDWTKAFGMVAVDYLGISLAVLGLVAAICASVKAHYAMLSVVNEFPQRELGSTRHNLLLTECIMIVVLFIWVGVLPIAALLFSGIAVGGSGLGAPPVPTPLWVALALVSLTFLFVLALEVVLTFVRLCFRVLPFTPRPIANATSTLDPETSEPAGNAEDSNAVAMVCTAKAGAADAPADFELKTR